MPFEIGAPPETVTAWSMMAAHKALEPYKATVTKFSHADIQIRFASLAEAQTALESPAVAVTLLWGIKPAPAVQVQMSIDQCLVQLSKWDRIPDKVKYEAMLTNAPLEGAKLFTEAHANVPLTFASVRCTYYYQGAYMAGDQFAVGAALKDDVTSRLILLYSEAEEGAAKRLVSFYRTSCGLTAKRLLPVKVLDSKAACDACREVVSARVDQVAPAIAIPALAFLTSIPGAAKLCPVGGATTDVAASIMSGDGKGNIAKWDNVDPNGNSYWRYRIDKFLDIKRIARTARYVIVWTRFSGKDGGAHKELDDSWTGLGQVCHALLKRGHNLIVVGKPRNGRDLEQKLTEHLDALDQQSGAVARDKLQIWGEYWKQDGQPNRKIIGPSRAAEYAIFLRMTSPQ